MSDKIIFIMPKPFEIQYIYKKQIGFTLQQKRAFEILESYNINVNQFVRQAIKEKIQRDWKNIKIEKQNNKLPF